MASARSGGAFVRPPARRPLTSRIGALFFFAVVHHAVAISPHCSFKKECDGVVQGGSFCNKNRNSCEMQCEGRWCQYPKPSADSGNGDRPVTGLVLGWGAGSCISVRSPRRFFCGNLCKSLTVTARGCIDSGEDAQTWAYHPATEQWESAAHPGMCIQYMDPPVSDDSQFRFLLQNCDASVEQQRLRPVHASGELDLDLSAAGAAKVNVVLKQGRLYVTKWRNRFTRLEGLLMKSERNPACQNSCYTQDLVVSRRDS